MKIDFSKAQCINSTNAIEFGICDKDNKEPAFIDVSNKESWIATVVNSIVPKQIQFTAIDNCIDIFNENGKMDSRCDAMLQYGNNLLFVELKMKRANWKAEGLGQIEATILRLIDEMPEFYYGFKKRKAIVANAKNISPAFNEFDLEQREYFKRKYKIHIQFGAEITIK